MPSESCNYMRGKTRKNMQLNKEKKNQNEQETNDSDVNKIIIFKKVIKTET